MGKGFLGAWEEAPGFFPLLLGAPVDEAEGSVEAEESSMKDEADVSLEGVEGPAVACERWRGTAEAGVADDEDKAERSMEDGSGAAT